MRRAFIAFAAPPSGSSMAGLDSPPIALPLAMMVTMTSRMAVSALLRRDRRGSVSCSPAAAARAAAVEGKTSEPQAPMSGSMSRTKPIVRRMSSATGEVVKRTTISAWE